MAEVISMFFQGVRIDDDVVKKYGNKLSNFIEEEMLQKPGKNCRGVGESEWHHQPLVQSKRGGERSFVYITLLDP
eukprot:CAMPEP_0184751528 /NCGR_PEP_ID=MMETSP0315-20130426/43089_1 /TAXON_ID=101924 /ORGANISM="Rhodosorus marinus, Strain UTEX LB 2760" /LENGTH=74 /DNA_ID=CAMNT_0027230789 /DNA_START=821 /DNA_END=1045 /DNA_ORIENTATION=-